jgi:glycerophosphoryl diester phosphodiesterase
VNAVKRFQRAHHLRRTGRVNQRTWNLIRRDVVRLRASRPVPLGPPPTILGHRGAVIASVAENTLASMRYAAPVSDVLEFDVRMTADHQFVLMHDTTLDRTTNCTGAVADWLLADLRDQCRADGDEPIPTFEEVAAFARSVPIQVAPQLAVASISDADLAEFVAVLSRHGLITRSYVQSFHPEVFARLRAINSYLTFVYLTASSTSPATVRNAGATIVGIRLGVTAQGVASYQRAGLKVWVWTVRTAEQLRALWKMKVNGVFTDIPATAQEIYH